MKRYVVNESEGVKGKLPVPGGGGTFNILIDEEMSGAKHFSLLVNEMAPGYKGKAHSHDVEHCWYILSGKGTMYIEGKPHRIGPDMAVFAPKDVLHRIDVDPEADLTYVLIYAPPGPEKKLKELGAHAFDLK